MSTVYSLAQAASTQEPTKTHCGRLITLLQVKQALYAATSVYCGAAGLLAEQIGIGKDASCFRGVLQMQHAHMQLVLQRVLHLQSLKSQQLQHPVLSNLNQQELAAVLGLPDPQHTFALTPLGTSVPTGNTGAPSSSSSSAAASSSKDASSSSGSSAWSATVTGAVAALRSGTSHWVKFVLGMQQELLSAIEAVATDALALHATYLHSGSQGSASSSSTAPGPHAAAGSGETSSTTADAVRALLPKLPDVWESVQQDTAAAEMAGVLQAMFNAEFRAYESVSSFMRGHLHQCPNGHFFVIGKCGGAMQESKCVVCGAVVGGRSHTLASGNQQADRAVLEQLQEQWAGAGRGHD